MTIVLEAASTKVDVIAFWSVRSTSLMLVAVAWPAAAKSRLAAAIRAHTVRYLA
jgi:hypothetical protein